jgi:phosphotransferase system enzyme I (PtsI)
MSADTAKHLPRGPGAHRIFSGVPASPGIAFGPAFVLSRTDLGVEVYALKSTQVEGEIGRFHKALEAAKADIRRERDELAKGIDARLAKIFDGHLGLLEDPELIGTVESQVRQKRRNAASVLSTLIEERAARLEKVTEAKLASIATDFRDVRDRVLRHLSLARRTEMISPVESSILIAHDLAPSQTTRLRDKVAAFATDVGGPVSHTALLAKALEIPAVVGLTSIASEVTPGTPLIVDGVEGLVIANPTAEEIEAYRKQRHKFRARESSLSRLKSLPAETRDGYLVDISANIELPEEVDHVIDHGASGIGLFRTEFLYLDQDNLPDEEKQFEVYRRVLERVRPQPVVFRTMDLGGDKFLSRAPVSREPNPFLGLRGIRLCLRYPEMFKMQLRAILRASPHGKARIMFPLVTSVQQVIDAKKILRQVRRQLTREGTPFERDIAVGIMIEVPSAALTADVLAEHVDFFSIGTNDLIQYTLAVDRVNEQVAHLYDPHHPSVLRLIRDVTTCAHRRGIWVSLCGEMASDPDLAGLLVGMGIDELSMAAVAIPDVKQRIRGTSLARLQELARDVLLLNRSSEIRELIAERIPKIVRARSRRVDAPEGAASRPI